MSVIRDLIEREGWNPGDAARLVVEFAESMDEVDNDGTNARTSAVVALLERWVNEKPGRRKELEEYIRDQAGSSDDEDDEDDEDEDAEDYEDEDDDAEGADDDEEEDDGEENG